MAPRAPRFSSDLEGPDFCRPQAIPRGINSPSTITAATAGYVPTSLDPLNATGPRRPFTNSLANPAFKSLLVHWNMLF